MFHSVSMERHRATARLGIVSSRVSMNTSGKTWLKTSSFIGFHPC